MEINVGGKTVDPTEVVGHDVEEHIQVIEPRSGWRLIDFGELWRYRDLFYFLVWRDIKVRYAQSILGVGWAIVQPLFFMLVFTVVFGRLVGVESDGVPYPIFTYTALVPWTFFSTALTDATGSLIQNANMMSKVYFPRLIMPLSSVLGKLLDFTIALMLVFALMAWYKTAPTLSALTLPLLVLLMLLSALGLGSFLTALAIQYRDVKYAMVFVVQLLMYAAPVVYPTSLIPEQYQLLYALNPMVGVIEGFRASLLGTTPMPWDLLAVGTVSATVIAVVGALYFHRMERTFADVV